MQAVVVAFPVLEHERRRSGLTGAVTALEERRVIGRETRVDAHRFVPTIRDGGERRIQRGAQLRDALRQRIAEIPVFAAAVAVPRHHDAAAEQIVARITVADRGAVGCRQHAGKDRAAIGVELLAEIVDGRSRHVASRSSNARLRSTPQR